MKIKNCEIGFHDQKNGDTYCSYTLDVTDIKTPEDFKQLHDIINKFEAKYLEEVNNKEG
jgi:hypothetical protein